MDNFSDIVFKLALAYVSEVRLGNIEWDPNIRVMDKEHKNNLDKLHLSRENLNLLKQEYYKNPELFDAVFQDTAVQLYEKVDIEKLLNEYNDSLVKTEPNGDTEMPNDPTLGIKYDKSINNLTDFMGNVRGTKSPSKLEDLIKDNTKDNTGIAKLLAQPDGLETTKKIFTNNLYDGIKKKFKNSRSANSIKDLGYKQLATLIGTYNIPENQDLPVIAEIAKISRASEDIQSKEGLSDSTIDYFYDTFKIAFLDNGEKVNKDLFKAYIKGAEGSGIHLLQLAEAALRENFEESVKKNNSYRTKMYTHLKNSITKLGPIDKLKDKRPA